MLLLNEHRPDSNCGGISFQYKGNIEVWGGQNRGTGHLSFQVIEGGGSLGGPNELVFSEQSGDWSCDGCVSFDEFPVEACQAKETAKVGSGSWNGPVNHGLDLLGVRGNAFCGYDMAQIVKS